jgi:hypothetical protein
LQEAILSEHFTIDSHVPVPKSDCGRRARYPFRKLQVGDSFWAPKATLNTRAWTRTTGRIFSYRREFKDGKQGVRVWRIA